MSENISADLIAVIEKRNERRRKKLEEGLRSKMKKAALKQCDPVVAKFAECAKGRTMSVIWACREEAKVMNECLHQFTSEEVLEEFKKQHAQAQQRQ